MGPYLVFLSWGLRNAKNKGYCSSDMPTVADDVHNGRMRPRWLPRGLSAGIVMLEILGVSSSYFGGVAIGSMAVSKIMTCMNVALEDRSSCGV